MRLRACSALGLLLALAGCVGAGSPPAPGYLHNRDDYAIFRAPRSNLLEPNYLPFMVERIRLDSFHHRLRRSLGLAAPVPEDLLVVCRWSDADFPLRIAILTPDLVDDPDAFRVAHPPEAYRAAVERALGLWETSLEGRFEFMPVDAAEDADLVIRLVAAAAAGVKGDEEVQVLGSTPWQGACEPTGEPLAGGVLPVRFRVPELVVRLADRHGLLLPDQVERIALHELGHALGMRGHSPVPADLMFRVARDRLPRGELGAQDVNSFLSLYALAPGTVYHRLGDSEAEPGRLRGPPPGLPALERAPHVDTRLGFEIQVPRGWVRIDTGRGLVAVDGTSWDFEASLEVRVRFDPSVEAFLTGPAGRRVRARPIVDSRPVEVAGREGLLLEHPTDGLGFVREVRVVASGDGRVLVITTECPALYRTAWGRWFRASLETLELRGGAEEADGRDYGIEPGS